VLTAKSPGKAGGKPEDGKSEPAEKADAALIVVGRDDKRKAHAGRFDTDNRAAAIKAAHLMGFVALAVTKDAMRNIAEGLPEGRIFDSGKAFVPFVKEGVCLALEAHAKQFPRDVLQLSMNQIAELEAEAAEADGQDGSADAEVGQDDESQTPATDSDETETKDASDNADAEPDAKSPPPAGRQDVTVGTTVLAVGDPDDGWWEAKVTQANKSGIGTNTITMLTLEWVDFPEEASFVRRANEVAYFHPAYGQHSPVKGTG
jgi:hypothetical protein